MHNVVSFIIHVSGGDVMTSIQLNKNHAKLYRELRLKGLIEAKVAFGSSYEEEAFLPLEFFENRLSDQNHMTFGMFDEDKLIGIATIRRSHHKKTKHNGHLEAMYIDRVYQNKGVGKKLLKDLMDFSQNKGVINFFLTVTITNVQAISFYKSIGFEIYGIEKKEIYHDGKYLDSTLMACYK